MHYPNNGRRYGDREEEEEEIDDSNRRRNGGKRGEPRTHSRSTNNRNNNPSGGRRHNKSAGTYSTQTSSSVGSASISGKPPNSSRNSRPSSRNGRSHASSMPAMGGTTSLYDDSMPLEGRKMRTNKRRPKGNLRGDQHARSATTPAANNRPSRKIRDRLTMSTNDAFVARDYDGIMADQDRIERKIRAYNGANNNNNGTSSTGNNRGRIHNMDPQERIAVDQERIERKIRAFTNNQPPQRTAYNHINPKVDQERIERKIREFTGKNNNNKNNKNREQQMAARADQDRIERKIRAYNDRNNGGNSEQEMAARARRQQSKEMEKIANDQEGMGIDKDRKRPKFVTEMSTRSRNNIQGKIERTTNAIVSHRQARDNATPDIRPDLEPQPVSANPISMDRPSLGRRGLQRTSSLMGASARFASTKFLPTLEGLDEEERETRRKKNKRCVWAIVAIGTLLIAGGIAGAVLPTVLRKDEVIVEELEIPVEVPVEIPVEVPVFVGKSCSAEGSTEGGNSSSVALPIQRGRRRLSMFDDDEAWGDDEGGLRLRQRRLRLPSKRDLGKDEGGLRALQSLANATDESAQSPTNQEQPNKPTSYPTMGGNKKFFKGLAWYDRNANGKRENKMTALGEDLEGEDVEYDYAVGGVEVRLVPCDEYTERSEFSEGDISKWNPTAKTGGYDGAGSPWLVPRRGRDLNGRFDIFVPELDTYYFVHVTAPEGFLLTSGVCNDDVFGWDCEYKNAVAALSRSAESERPDIAIGVRTGRSPKCTKGGSKKAPLYFGVMRESDNKVLSTIVALVLKFDEGDLLEGGEEAAAIGTVTAVVLASELEQRFAMDGTMELNSVESRDVFLLKNEDANVAGNEISVVMDVKALIPNFDTNDVTRRLQDFDSGIDSTAFNDIIQDSINRDSAKIERNLKDFNLRCREQQSSGLTAEDGDVFSTVCSENLVLPDYFETSLTEIEAKSVSEVDSLKCEVESRRLESIETTSSSTPVQVAYFVYCLVLMLGIMFMSI